jgi:DDE superfamily endonuclease
VQLTEEVRLPLPAAPGRPARFDYEYKRNGTANLFIAFAPLLGWRAVRVTARRTKADFAEFLRWVVEEAFAAAGRLVLVTDNLNTHTPGPLYEALLPPRARAVAERLEWHYTPKHGSWLNVAEAEWSVLSRQCLGRRIGTAEELRREVESWAAERNRRQVGVNWQFTHSQARLRLRHLYPSLQ